MILVDIQATVLNKTYDFELKEEAPVGEIINQIIEEIEEREQLELVKNPRPWLYVLQKELLLEEEYTLEEQGVMSGETLLLL